MEELIFAEGDRSLQLPPRASRPAPDPADPRRGAPVRDHRAPRAARQGARHLVAGGNLRHRRQAPATPAGAFRRPEGRTGRQRRRAGAGGRHQPRAGRKNLPRTALAVPLNLPNLLTWLRDRADPADRRRLLLSRRTGSTMHERNLLATVDVHRRGDHRLAGRLSGAALNQMSAFGAFLDPVADKLMVAAALIVLVNLDAGRHGGRARSSSAARSPSRHCANGWRKMGEAKSVAVAMLGKIKTVPQMVAIPMLLYHEPVRHRSIRSAGHAADLRRRGCSRWCRCSTT